MTADKTAAEPDQPPVETPDQPPVETPDQPAGTATRSRRAARAAETPAAVTTETTAALHGTPAPESTDAPRPFLSEGVRSDLEIWGQATDPATGGVFKRDKSTGTVTFTDRAGEVTEVR